MIKKVKYVSCISLAIGMLFILSSCSIQNLLKRKVVNEIENRYIDYSVEVTVKDLEEALIIGSDIAKSCSVGIKVMSRGLLTSMVSTGSGVIVQRAPLDNASYQYYVVTNRHVIEKSSITSLKIYLGEQMGYQEARIVATDSKNDLALLSFDSPFLLATAKLSTKVPVTGQLSIVVGCPYDLEDYYNTVTCGIISAPSRYHKEEDANGYKVQNEYIQHDASINSGNSGGGLFDIQGQLIGINTWKVVGDSNDKIEGLSFAIPVKYIRETFGAYLDEI